MDKFAFIAHTSINRLQLSCIAALNQKPSCENLSLFLGGAGFCTEAWLAGTFLRALCVTAFGAGLGNDSCVSGCVAGDCTNTSSS